mmetsp:Transcript_13343/g.46579  ORF Transcript_13343/g.46579 Transcript_13343/m.46579 type:complete len:207 (+) Transcript_13343:392-1012(+)
MLDDASTYLRAAARRMQTRLREHMAIITAVLHETRDIHASTREELKRIASICAPALAQGSQGATSIVETKEGTRMQQAYGQARTERGHDNIEAARMRGSEKVQGRNEDQEDGELQEERELLVQKVRDYKELSELLERGMEHMRRKHEAAVRQVKANALRHAQQLRRMMNSMLLLVRSGQLQHLQSLDLQTLSNMIGGNDHVGDEEG